MIVDINFILCCASVGRSRVCGFALGKSKGWKIGEVQWDGLDSGCMS